MVKKIEFKDAYKIRISHTHAPNLLESELQR